MTRGHHLTGHSLIQLGIGNDHDEDSDREEAPVKVIDKTPARTTKRNAPAEAPASKNTAHTEGRGGRRGGFTGNEGGQSYLCTCKLAQTTWQRIYTCALE